MRKEVWCLKETVMGCLLFLAAVCDVKKRKIPNAVILTGWLLSLLLRFWQEGMTGIFKSLASMAVILAAGFLLFWIRAMGAGDVKLWSVIGGMHGISYFFHVFVVMLVLTGSWSFVRLWRNKMLKQRFAYAWSYFFRHRAGKEPYYDEQRDGTKCTILLAPFTAAAYFLVLLERWGGLV